MQQDCGRNFFAAKSYACNKKGGGMYSTIYSSKKNFFTPKSYGCNILKIWRTLKIEYDHISKAK